MVQSPIAIILFTRVPVAGATKTRLEKMLTPAECAQLHGAFLQDVYQICQQSGMDLYIFYTPEGELDILQSILGKELNYLPQAGQNLGEKMHKALAQTLAKGYDSCLLIGADIPLLGKQDLTTAAELLHQYDVVFIPTLDGGYCLVGLKTPNAELLQNHAYGSASVLNSTLAKAHELGLKTALAKPQLDIDEPEDLQLLLQKLKEPQTATPPQHTIALLKAWQMLV